MLFWVFARVRSIVAVLVSVVAIAGAALAAPPCSDGGDGWCVARRFPGLVPEAELGFRFGEPLDADGDGVADIAAGARFVLRDGHQAGRAYVWSGKTGAVIRSWDGPAEPGLFGHWVLPIPDLDGDGRADVVIAAPSAVVDGVIRGIVAARSPRSGAELWRRSGGSPRASLGWDLALAGDHDGDGRSEVFVGQPAPDGGRVLLLSGKDGRVIRTYAPRATMSAFGWFVARLDDLDGDGRADLAVGAQPQHSPDDPPGGAAYVLSSGSGDELQHWRGKDPFASFGEVVAAVADADGDGRGDVAVAAPGTRDHGRTLPGEVVVYSSKTGTELRRWSGTQAGELYGRMVVAAGDVDGDGVDDVVIGAPWHRCATGDRCGRVELRSGKSGAVLHELAADTADTWFGWHIRRAPDPDGRGRPTLLIASLRAAVDGKPGVGALEIVVLRDAAPTPGPTGGSSRAAPGGATSDTPADRPSPGG